jgi:hypothetical protein
MRWGRGLVNLGDATETVDPILRTLARFVRTQHRVTCGVAKDPALWRGNATRHDNCIAIYDLVRLTIRV